MSDAMDEVIVTEENSKTSVLMNWEKELTERQANLKDKEQELTLRESRVTAKEDALNLREEKIGARMESLDKREEAVADLEKKHAELMQDEKVIAAKSEELSNKQAVLDERQAKLDKLQTELFKTEQEIQTAAAARQAEEISAVHSELEKMRQEQIVALMEELAKIRAAVAAETDKIRAAAENDANAKRTKTTAELDKRRVECEEEINNKRAQFAEEIQAKRAALDAEEQNLKEEKANLAAEKKSLEFDRLRTKKQDETLKSRQANIAEEVLEANDEYRKSMEEKLAAAHQENDRLRGDLKSVETKLVAYDSFKAVYGDNPDALRRKIDTLNANNENLQNELGKRPGLEVQQECERLKAENLRLQNDLTEQGKLIGNAQEQAVELEKLRNSNVILEESKNSLYARWVEAQDLIKNYEAQIKRLTATEEQEATREERINAIREQKFLSKPFNAPKMDKKDAMDIDEIEWLNQIEKNCIDYGLQFPRRILYAFHTSFKIANWSMLTVLAGVSGTGKSELPKLYSAFGGLNFISEPVQPNWDSQESMLGFFNSIDNKFDAKPVLRFLVECTEKYDNNMAVVLLDEMNLAHVEHYFADFLSKLEDRRSAPESNLPEIYVNLGAGVKPYGLPLKRNILWCGTMNQDETTKSLSDKVLDRGIVINFPRPRTLKDREGAGNLDVFCAEKGITPLSKQVWNTWRVPNIKFRGKQADKLKEYRYMLEEMNDKLSIVGRAIGHRVWQSIAHYVMNYPTVRAAFLSAQEGELTDELAAAMHIAVEDQIVQKVMPKLRGIDTRGKSLEECLKPIKMLLQSKNFNLDKDFELACTRGYGQFMWSSAEYIEDDPISRQEGTNANQ